MLNQRMLCRAFRPPKLRKIEKYTTSDAAKRRDRQFSLVGRQISGLLTSLAPWTGAPGSHQRTWEEKDGAKPPPKLLYPDQGSVTPGVKACEKNHFQPRYAGANLGHPSRGQGLAGSRESGGERTANRPTELKSFLFSLAIGESTAPRDDKVRVCASMQRCC